jgi:nicotinamide-nucleotide amidase
MSAAALELRSRLLGPPRRTLAVAESLTGGRLQALVTGVSGASAYFLGGLTAYTIPQKTRLLGVDAAHAAEVDAVSGRVAAEMACGACRLFGADFGVATTGYAEPAPGRGVAHPGAWVAVANCAWAAPHRVPRPRPAGSAAGGGGGRPRPTAGVAQGASDCTSAMIGCTSAGGVTQSL